MSRASAAISGVLGCLQTEARTTAIVSASSGAGFVIGCFTAQDVGENARSRVRTAQLLDHRALREERAAESSDLVLKLVTLRPRLPEIALGRRGPAPEDHGEPPKEDHAADREVERPHVS